jgi:glycosyltransferase involved in cell wall biosynthesis
MKILFIITKAVVGGAQMSVLNLARELKSRGHEVTVGFGDGDFLPAELDKEKISHVHFRNLKRTSNPLAGIFFILELKSFLRKNKFTVVHFNSSNALPGALGAKLADKKIKTVFTFRGMSMLDEHYKMNALLRLAYFFFFKFFLFFVDAPVFVSQENFDKFGRGQLTANGVMIYNGLDPEKLVFLPKNEAVDFLKAKTGLNNAYFIGSIGRLDYQKNYEFLINIFPEILKIKPEAILTIIGGGPEEENYRQLIEKNNLSRKIFLLGSIPNASRFIKGFDLFVLPSRYEGLSITLIEALFAGSPIIATDVGGNKETVALSEEIYRLDNQEEFLQKFKQILNIETGQRIVLANKQQVEIFLLKNTAAGYEKIYGKE